MRRYSAMILSFIGHNPIASHLIGHHSSPHLPQPTSPPPPPREGIIAVHRSLAETSSTRCPSLVQLCDADIRILEVEQGLDICLVALHILRGGRKVLRARHVARLILGQWKGK